MRSNIKNCSTKAKAPSRNEDGISLVVIMGMGIVAAIWMLSMTYMVVPAAQRINHETQELNVRAGAESAADWSIAQINSIYGGGSATLQDDVTTDGSPTPSASGAGQTPACTLPTGVTAQIWVNNVQPPTNSYIYDITLDPSKNASIPPAPAGQAFGWRIITAKATQGKYSKTIRVIARPEYPVTTAFTMAVLSNGTQTWTGNHSSMDGYNSSTGQLPATAGGTAIAGNNSIGSFASINLGGSISGNVTYYGPGASSGSANITGGNGGSPKPIWGQVQSNDSMSVIQSGEATGQVQGYIPPVSGTGPPTQGPQWVNPAPTPPTITVPSKPSTAIQLTSAWLASPTPLPPGDYYTTSNLNVTSSVYATGASGAVRIWETGGNLSIGAGGDMTNYNASRLQIYYAGNSGSSSSISLNGSPGQFCGCVMAPNVNVSINGQGHFYGAIVCNQLSVHGSGNSGGMSFDQALLKSPVTFPDPPILRVVSWQEL